MKDLKKLFEDLNFQNVKTFINSGNIIFESSEDNITKLENRIEEELQKTFGFRIDTIIRTELEMNKILQNNPFKHIQINKEIKVYISLLKTSLNKVQLSIIKTLDTKIETYKATEKEVFTLVDKTKAESPFSNNSLEKNLKIVATTRDLNSLNRFIKLLSIG